MLSAFCDWLLFDLFELNPSSKVAHVLHFFVADAIKIMLLLFVMIFMIGFLRSFLPQEKIKQWLTRRGVLGNLMAALLGAITPFCSCSSIPMFFGFLKTGVPLGVTFSFLITSPLINEYLAVLMIGTFGWKITLAYVISGLAMGTIGGMVLGSMKLEHLLMKDIINDSQVKQHEQKKFSFYERLHFGWQEAISIINKLWIWILVGVGIGALIHNFVPQEAIQAVLKKTGIFSVPLATFIGVPLYGSCASIVPVAVVLFEKGLPIGTALSFMMAMSALSLPEAVLLKRAMSLKLIVIFFSITTTGIIVTGYVFNVLQPLLVQTGGVR